MLILSPARVRFCTSASAGAPTSPSIPSKGAEGQQLHGREVEELLLAAPLLHLHSHDWDHGRSVPNLRFEFGASNIELRAVCLG